MTEITSTIGKVGSAAPTATEVDPHAAAAAASIPQAIQPGLDPIEDLGPPLPPLEGQEQQEEEEKKPMPLPNLRSLVELGKIRDHITIGGLRFEMETLDDDAQREIFKRMVDDDDTSVGADSFVRLRRLTVALALTKLNDQAFEDVMSGKEDAIDKKVAIVSKMQDSVVEKLFDFYNNLLEQGQEKIAPDQVKN